MTKYFKMSFFMIIVLAVVFSGCQSEEQKAINRKNDVIKAFDYYLSTSYDVSLSDDLIEVFEKTFSADEQELLTQRIYDLHRPFEALMTGKGHESIIGNRHIIFVRLLVADEKADSKINNIEYTSIDERSETKFNINYTVLVDLTINDDTETFVVKGQAIMINENNKWLVDFDKKHTDELSKRYMR